MLININLRKNIPKRDLKKFLAIWKMINVVFDYVHDDPKRETPTYRCHSICRAIKANTRLGVRVIDGYYIGATHRRVRSTEWKSKYFRCEHTWLLLPGGSIVDVYPVGIMSNPLLVVGRGKYKRFGSDQYVHDSRVTKNVMTAAILEETRATTTFVREAMAWKKLNSGTK